MPKKSTEEMIEDFALMVGRGFEEVQSSLRLVRAELSDGLSQTNQQIEVVVERLERVEFLITGQDRRISTLQDRMRQVATKLGLSFN